MEFLPYGLFIILASGVRLFWFSYLVDSCSFSVSGETFICFVAAMSSNRQVDPLDPDGLLDEAGDEREQVVVEDPGDWAAPENEVEIELDGRELEDDRAFAGGDDDEPMDGNQGETGILAG